MGDIGNGWSLEVVRGRDTGRVYALGRGVTVLGNALGGAPGLDLASHEGDSPRRMAARQAQLDLDLSAPGPTLRDLDSPGGTFVNSRRILPGQALPLRPGDLIQLGGVQLKLVAGSPATSPEAVAPTKSRPAPPPVAPSSAPAPARPTAPASTPRPAVAPAPGPAPPPPVAANHAPAGALPTAFTLATGARCRTWDDFLTVAAQRWGSLRDELVSGRLGAFLASIGRGEMAPSPRAPGTPDERLDAWLGSLPTTRPSRPELDVHPAVLSLRATPGGGVLRASLQVANIGYRLLKTTVRVEPPSAATWIKLPASLMKGPMVTVDQTALPIEVHVPETFDTPPAAALVLESNGGTRRVEVRLERPPAAFAIPDEVPTAAASGLTLRDLVARQRLGTRLVVGIAGGLLLRGLAAAAVVTFGAGAEGARPPLPSVAALLAILGGVAAALFAIRRGEPGDAPASGFAGGFAGVLVAALLVAACRTIEPRLLPGTGPGASPLSACLLWGILGAGLAVVSALLVPPRSSEEVPS